MSASSQTQTSNEHESAASAAPGKPRRPGTSLDLATEADGRVCMIVFLRDATTRRRFETLQQRAERLHGRFDDCTLQLQRSEERQRVLLEINNAVVAPLDRKALSGAIGRTLRSVASFDEAAIYLHDPARDVFRLYALEESSSSRRGVGEELGRRGTHVGWYSTTRRPSCAATSTRTGRSPWRSACGPRASDPTCSSRS